MSELSRDTFPSRPLLSLTCFLRSNISFLMTRIHSAFVPIASFVASSTILDDVEAAFRADFSLILSPAIWPFSHLIPARGDALHD
jgi:hypothetical protein